MKEKNLFEKIAEKAGEMTLEGLHDRVRILANSSHTRFWVEYARIGSSWQSVMAIQCIGRDGKPVGVLGMESDGFVVDNIQRKNGNDYLYLIRRINSNGEPWTQVV